MNASLFAGVAVVLAATSTAPSAQEFDAKLPLYTSEAKGHALDQLPGILDRAYAAGRPVVIYVHGRGHEPRKSFDREMPLGGVVSRLEREYAVSVVLFNWNSKAWGVDRTAPLENIPDAVAAFKDFLARLAAYRRTNASRNAPTLLVHSMGSIVVAEAIKSAGWAYLADGALFASVLLSAPDVDSQGHAEWLQTVAVQERVYVTQNSSDPVLKGSTNGRQPKSNFALGLEPVPPLAPGAFYVDLSDALGSRSILIFSLYAHQIFNKGWMGGNAGTCTFVSKVLRGERFDLNALEGVTRSSGNRYAMKRQIDKNNACFKDAGEAVQLD